MSRTASDRIREINAATQAWVAEDPEARWATLYVEDQAFWSEMGIETAEQFDHHRAMSAHYDGYKDLHGIRPRWIDYSIMTTAEIIEMTDRMYDNEECRLQGQSEADREAARKEAEALNPTPLTYNPFAKLVL